MNVEELIEQLQGLPPDARVVVNFDVSDHDTMWEVYAVEPVPNQPAVLIKAK